MAWRKAIVAAVFVVAGMSSAHAQEFGPNVGDVLPPISAMDQAGAQRDLASLSGENGLVLLVTRAADWCPYCQQQMIEIEGIRPQIERRGWRVATVSTDTVDE
ncbi:MAG: redoxin domain-containing protein, partial [Devosia sp.]